MKHKIFLFLFSLVLTLSPGSVERVLACSCASERPVCEAFGASNAVFVGKVIGAKQRKTTNYDGVQETWDVGEIYFQVEEAFHGVKKGTRVTISSGTGGGDCGYWFKRGKTYLIYGYGDAKKGFGTNICTRTREISGASEDLEFLRNLPPEDSGARIYGKVAETVKNPDEEGWRQFKPLFGISLTIQNTRNPKIIYKAETDIEGNYEVTGVPAGKYKIIPSIPKNTIISEYSTQEFEVNDRGCAELSFQVQNNSLIKGKVVDSEGKPVQNIRVEMIPEKQKTKPHGLGDDTALTDENGNFEFETIPAGSYFLAVNYIDAPDADAPFPTTFYPYALEKSEAIPLQIEKGQKIGNIVFRLPPRLIEKKVYGSVFWEDGNPSTEVNIYLEDTERLGWCVNGCFSKTDKQGNFILSGYFGRSYRIRASGEKFINGQQKEFFAELLTFTMKEDIPSFKVILNLTKDPTKEGNKENTDNIR